MDTLLSLLCLILGLALPAAGFGLLARRGWRQTAAPAAYRQVARELQLEVDTRGASVNGYLVGDRRRLYVGEVMVGHGAERRVEHRAVLSLERPLGLGLAVRKRAGRRWFRRARGHEIKTADPEFDKVFLVTGDDDAVVRALLDAPLRERLAALARRHPDLLVSDHHLRLLLRRAEVHPEAVHGIVRDLRALADELVRARARTAPPVRLGALAPALADLAASRELALDPSWPLLAGERGGHAIELAIRREDEGYRAEVTAWRRVPTDFGFRLRRQVEPDGYWSVGQDIQVDDGPFDAAFVIKGYAPDRVRERLGPETRRRLLSLTTLGEVEADDHLLRVRGVPLDPAALADAVDRCAAAIAALEPISEDPGAARGAPGPG